MYYLVETQAYVYLLSQNETLKIEKGTSSRDVQSIISVEKTPNRNATLRMLRSSNNILKEFRVFALLGFLRFTADWYAVVVTKVKELGVFGICEIQEIEKIRIEGSSEYPVDAPPKTKWTKFSSLFTPNQVEAIEKKYLTIFKSLEMNKGFYFSKSYALHRTLQENISPKSTIRNPRRDIFIWNSGMQYLEKWCVPLIYGYCGVSRINVVGRHVVILIISRRSRVFAGTRYLKRGLHDSGHVANHVETEQIVIDLSSIKGREEDLNGTFSSFVQVRGSIPVFWSQRISKKVVNPKPDIVLGTFDPLHLSARKHFNNLMQDYGCPIICLDLVKKVEKKPREAPLGAAYADCIAYLNKFLDDNSKLQYIPWDFKVATKNKPDVFLNDLTAISEETLETTSFFYSSPFSKGRKLQLQKGVLRTNCIDCLDRTNIAQFFLSKHVLGHQLYRMGIIESPHLTNYNSILESVMIKFVEMGDQIALQYGGSPTVSAGVNHRGFTWDVITSAQRYYSNNFTDTTRQHAINLLLQNFKYSPHGAHIWELDTDYDQYLDLDGILSNSTVFDVNTMSEKKENEIVSIEELPFIDNEELFVIPKTNNYTDRSELFRNFEGKISREFPLESEHVTKLTNWKVAPSIVHLENNYDYYKNYNYNQQNLVKSMHRNKRLSQQHMTVAHDFEGNHEPQISPADLSIYKDYCNMSEKFVWKRRNEEYTKSYHQLLSTLEEKISPEDRICGYVFSRLRYFFPSCVTNDMISEQVDILLDEMASGLVICDRVRLPRINIKTFQSLFDLVQGRVYRKCFLGSRAVDWILKQKKWCHLSRREATKLMELLLEGEAIHHVVYSEMPFQDDFNLYRIEKYNPTRVLNMDLSTSSMKDDIDPCNLSMLLVEEMLTLLKIVFPNSKRWKHLHSIPATESQKIYNSQAFAEYLQHAANLCSLNITELNKTELKCFFINIFNALYMHCVLIKGTTRIYQKAMYAFCGRMSYNIAGKLFSLQEIREGVLGGNRHFRNAIHRPFTKPNDLRLIYAIEDPDPRIMRICPYPQIMFTPIVNPNNLEDVLQSVTIP